MNAIPYALAAVIAAPFVGSFLAALAYRLPRGLGFVGGRSRCDGCGARLGIAELIPIVSWLWARGRCRHCGGAIAIDNLALEIAALGLAAWAGWVMEGWLIWATCGLGWCLLACAAIDFRHLLLPDGLTLPLLVAGLGVAGALAPGNLAGHALGAIAGFSVFAAIAWVYRRARGRDGLGLGDAKLVAALGAWVGWPGLPSVVLFAAVSAITATLAVRKFKAGGDSAQPIAFGPYLALSGWLVWLYGPLEITF
jgi:leader peptidase (prepilin peptidase)/N-methyltransferase